MAYLEQAADDSGPEDEDSKMSELPRPAHDRVSVKLTRLKAAKRSTAYFQNAKYGELPTGEHYAELRYSVPLNTGQLLLDTIVKRAVDRTQIRSTPGIKHVHCIEGKDRTKTGEPRWHVQTEGCNLHHAYGMHDMIEEDRIECNDPHAICLAYGIEAARTSIINEIRAVFGAYGIDVAYAHLALLADYMTHEGHLRPCNRIGIRTNTSPFLKMSFETLSSFMTQACLTGAYDDLATVSAKLVTGQVPDCGTGSFEILAAYKPVG